jgi:hypothetical protein
VEEEKEVAGGVMESRREKSSEAVESKGVAVRPLRKRVRKEKEIKELNEIKGVEDAAPIGLPERLPTESGQVGAGGTRTPRRVLAAGVWRGWWLSFKEDVTIAVPFLSRNNLEVIEKMEDPPLRPGQVGGQEGEKRKVKMENWGRGRLQ